MMAHRPPSPRSSRATLAVLGGAMAFGLGLPDALANETAEDIVRSLAGADADARHQVADALVPHGPDAVDVLIAALRSGDLDRALALQAIAYVQSGGATAPPRPLGALQASDDAPPSPDEPPPEPSGDLDPEDLMSVAGHYTLSDGYDPLDAESALIDLIESWEHDSGSVFLPGRTLGPLTQAVLLMDHREGPLPHVRYRIRYALEWLPQEPRAVPMEVSAVQVDRFNMGPVLHAETARSVGEDAVAPVEEFGEGPHVSYRMVSRPVQGRTADLVALSRKDLSDAEAGQALCLDNMSCLDPRPVAETVPEPWEDLPDEAATVAFDGPYSVMDESHGTHSPAAVVDLLTELAHMGRVVEDEMSWLGPEPREGVDFLEPFVEIVLDVNLAQDFAVEGVLRDSNLMDDELATIWFNAVSLASGDPAAPAIFAARASERHPWRQ